MWIMWGLHNLSLLGAGVAFFTFLALTPLIAATVMAYGLVGDVATVRQQMQEIILVVPPDVARLIESQMLGAVTANAGVTGVALAIAMGFAVFGGMRAATGMIGALNIINEERESRGLIAQAWQAAILTVVAVLIGMVGLASGGVFAYLHSRASALLGPTVTPLVEALTGVAAMALGAIGFAVVMRYGPDRRPAQWRWLMPGALLATLLWTAVSFSFSLYVAFVTDFNATYGSLSAVVVFLMWLFLSAYGVLAGALLNAEIERQTTVDTTIGPERPLGERGAVLADLAEGGLSLEDWIAKTERRAIRRKTRAAHLRRLLKKPAPDLQAAP